MRPIDYMSMIAGQVTMKVTNWGQDSADLSGEEREPADITEGANVVTSKRKLGEHKVLLDLDVPALLVPSSTPGHSHLYIDVQVPEHKYWRLLDVLADCKVIERGYADASKKKGGTALRLPWVKKESASQPVEVLPF